MTVPKPKGGIPPKPASKRRRVNKPLSYGLAEPIVAGKAAEQPDLGFKAHFLVEELWTALGESVEGRFFSRADWQRAKWEMYYANELFTGVRQMTPVAWAAVQHGLTELLISPSDKRRVGIELTSSTSDPDEEAAVSQLAQYRNNLTG